MADLFPNTGGSPRRVRVIDFETTGTPEDEGAEIIELGRIDVDLVTRDIGNAWTSLARPRSPIPPVTMAVHHITDEDVASSPQLATLWQPFFEGCAPEDLLAAHNAQFEQHFHKGNGRAWIDTYKCALVVWPDAPTHSNQGLRYCLGLDLDRELASPPHRALPDAYVTAHILNRLLDEKSPDELVQISKYPALLRRITFGTKAKGQLFSEAPLDYLEWIAAKSDLNADTKFTARYWLKKRGW
ncbi:exonuclease domain-containing protein [Kaistia sp. MMO-174]|uniref:exonuclease domain-containing protein n=1 Tax=Kaistia sp. MMO-174 TaxID=3081256 RepID=UPI00301631BC